MADEVPVTTTAPAPAPLPEHVAAAPTVSPQTAAASSPPPTAESAPSPAPAVAPPVPEQKADAGKPAEPAEPVQPTPAPTLLEKFDQEKAEAAKKDAKPEADKTAEKPAEASKPTEAAAAPAAPAVTSPVESAPFEYKYTLPETIKMDDAMKGEVHKAFDDFRANPTEGAQALLNLHEKQMQEFAQKMSDEQHRVWNETRQAWAKQVMGDPELGGSGYQTTMGAVARMRDLFVADKDRPAFEEMLRTTGVGDHPAFLRMLHQAARFYDEPTMPPPNPRPPASNGPRPARRLRDIYDQTRANAEGRS